MPEDFQAQRLAATGPDGARFAKLRRQAYIWCAPGLLCVIALTQIARVRTTLLTPWKGGGFGMFSTVDSVGARFVKIYVQTADGVDATSASAPDTELLRKIHAAPAERDVRLLADGLLYGDWVEVERSKVAQKPGSVNRPRMVRLVNPGEPAPPENLHVECTAVRVEVWKYRFAPAANELQSEKILEATASVAGRAP
jgi:hypothetical protein